MIKKCCMNCEYYKVNSIYDNECVDCDWCELYESETPYTADEENDCRDFSEGVEGHNELHYLW